MGEYFNQSELRPSFLQHGKKEDRTEVTATDVLDAIAKGWDIDIEYADIKGDLDIYTIADQLDQDEHNNLVIKGGIEIRSSVIHANTMFRSVTFNADVKFISTTFSKFAHFDSAIFGGDSVRGTTRYLFRRA